MKSTPTNIILAEAAEMSLEYRRKWLAAKFLAKPITILNHPLILVLKQLRMCYMKNAGFWSSEKTPYLILALELYIPHYNKMYRKTRYPCYEIEYETQILPIKNINLNLNKKDIHTKEQFLSGTDKYKNSYKFVYTDA